MNEIVKQLKLEKLEYFETHLSIVNCFLPIKLTPMEIKVLSSFMSLNGDIAKDRFGTSAKKLVRTHLGNMSPASMSNYIKDLKEKGFLLEEGNTLSILPILFPKGDEQLYMFKLTNIG